jgi:long-chain acyl-CoA synthetase
VLCCAAVNLAHLIDEHPEDAVALISDRRTMTYGELRADVAALRGGLIGLGLGPGDRVGIIGPNAWEFVVTYLGVLGAGLVAVPLNPQSPSAELEAELAAIGARAAVVGPGGPSAAAELDRNRVPALEHLIVAGGGAGADQLAFEDLLGATPSAMLPREPEDLAALIFTSGTAGSPKAAMLSHQNLRSNIEQAMSSEERRQRPDDVIFGVLPLFHIFGLNVVIGISMAGGSKVLLVDRFDPAPALAKVAEHAVTIIPGVPTMWTAWAQVPDADPAAMASVRLATSGAARLPIETFEAVRDRLGVTLGEGYGLTEASPIVTTSTGREPKPGSIGVPLPGMEVRLVDESGEDALVGDAGEIWVRGPNVFQGYWNDAEATRAALTEDGWLRTGDLAVVDDDGYLYLVDRMKDLIIVSGFNVYPAEVEEVLIEHPAVAECAVIGVPHPTTGEAVKAYVVVEDGDRPAEDELHAFVADRLARYKCPSEIAFVDALPLNASGKVLRRELR